jgi:diguanylate cyclase (GGDEF)-like protein
VPNQFPADLTPSAMLLASLVLAVLLLIVFCRKSFLADRLVAAAERRADRESERAAALEAVAGTPSPAVDRDDVMRLLEDLPRALRDSDDAESHRQVGESLGAGLARLLSPQQWMVFLDVEGDGTQFALVAAAAKSGGTWPVGACLTPQMGRVGLAIRRKRTMDRTDFLAEPPIVRKQLGASEPGVFKVDAVAPIVLKDRVVGAISVGGSQMPSDVTRAVLQVFANQAVILHRLATARERAVRLENLDDATDLHNRNWFTAQGAELLFDNRDQMVPIVCGVFGIDDFRIYATREGPSQTRHLLRTVANVIRPMFRVGDLVCRWTEDEFAILLPNMDRGSGRELLDDIRHQIASTQFPGAENQPAGAVTVSVGMAMAPEDGQNFDDLIDHAYRAFQTSRKRGGDRTSGEVDVDEEFLDVVSGLAQETPLRDPGASRHRD